MVVDQDGRVAIEPDIRPVAAPLFFDRPDDHRFHDLPLLDVRFGRRFLHRRRDDVSQAGVAARRAADRIDDRDLARAGVVGDVQDRSHLDHGCFSEAGRPGKAGWAGRSSFLPVPCSCQSLNDFVGIKAAGIIHVHVGETNGSFAVYQKRAWNGQLSIAACAVSILEWMTEPAIQFKEVITQFKHNPKLAGNLVADVA